MNTMPTVVFLLSCLITVKAGSHSLMVFGTYIAGQTQFPEFSAVVMLDDLQVLYYDSITQKPVPHSQSNSEYKDTNYTLIFRDMHDLLKYRTFYVKDNWNLTDGLHVYQKHAGCELLDNDEPGLFLSWDAFNGKNTEEFTFDVATRTVQNTLPWMRIKNLSHLEWLQVTFLYKNVYHPICIKTLRRFLGKEKKIVMRKVKPRVRLIKKRLPDCQGLQISCLATGFYPRHINLTLFRDTEPVDDDQITGGEILPNGDGTYQMRKTLIISKEELHERHQYNCTMKHLDLDNKLDLKFDSDEFECDPGFLSLSTVIGGLVLCMSVITTALIVWRKRRAAGLSSSTSHQSVYFPASTAEQETR